VKASVIGIFFSKYLWLGIVWLLFAIILDKSYGQTGYGLYLIIKMVESIALAIIVASIFTYTLGTTEFINKIRNLLENIVVSRKFLENLSKEGKIEALKEILKPSDLERARYINIESYYDDYVKKSLDISSKNLRSNYCISANAFYDDEKHLVGIRTIYSYRLYPSETGYKDIRIGFDKEDSHSYCEKICINKPDGTRMVHENVVVTPQNNLGSEDRLGSVSLEDIGNSFDHLDIEVHTVEYGNDHWFMYTFKALQPTDGFRLHLQCSDMLEIRKYAIFDTGNAYHVDTVGNLDLIITCHQWIKEGVGVSVLISALHEINTSDIEESLGPIVPSSELVEGSAKHVT